MSKFDINFYNFSKQLSHSTTITKSIQPISIKSTGIVTTLPSQINNSSEPTSSSNISCSLSNLTNTQIKLATSVKAAQSSISIETEIDDIDFDTIEKQLYRGTGIVSIAQSSDEIQLSIPGFKYNNQDFIMGTDAPSPISGDSLYIPAYELLLNTKPICNPRALIDANLWYTNKISSGGGIYGDAEDTSHYEPRETNTFANKFWSIPLGGTTSSDIQSIDYSDYKKMLKSLKDKLLPQGISFDVIEYRDDDYMSSDLYSAGTTFGNMKVSDISNPTDKVYFRSQVFILNRIGTDFKDIEPTPVDISFRELMRALYDSGDQFDRRNIKSRDTYENDIDGISNVVNIVSDGEYEELYRHAYTQMARFLIPVDFGFETVKTKICVRGVERTVRYKKKIGIHPVLISFQDTSSLSGFGKNSIEVDSFNTEIETETIEAIATYKIPNLPGDTYLRKLAFDAFGSIDNKSDIAIFNSESTSLENLKDDIANKIEFLLKLLKNKFGSSKVILSTTIKDNINSGNSSSYLSWHNYGRGARILIYNSDDVLIEDNSVEYFQLKDIADIFIKGCLAGWFGTPMSVTWMAQLVVNPDQFEWEFLPIGYTHKDSYKYRKLILNQIDPVTGDFIQVKDVQDFISLINVKFDAHRSTILDVEGDVFIDVPLDKLIGPISSIDDSGDYIDVSVGDIVELSNQVDSSLDGVWLVNESNWTVVDKYITWMLKNPISYDQLIQYNLLVGEYSIVRALLSIKLVHDLSKYDEDSSTYVYDILRFFENGIINSDFINSDALAVNKDRIRLTSPGSPGSFVDLYNRHIYMSMYDMGLNRPSSYTYNSIIEKNTNKLFSVDGAYSGVDVGYEVSGHGIPVGTVVESIPSVDFIVVSLKSTISSTATVTFKKPKTTYNNNIHGQSKIDTSDVSSYIKSDVAGGYLKLNTPQSSVISDSDRTRILDEIKVNILDEINKIKSTYTNLNTKFLNDSYHEDDVLLFENEFGVIDGQNIVSIPELTVIYNKYNNKNKDDIIYDDDLNGDPTVLNIFEETISIARGIRISTIGKEKPIIEDELDTEIVKKELERRFTNKDNKFDSREF